MGSSRSRKSCTAPPAACYDSGPENRDDCLAANKDIVLLPSDVTLDEMTFTELNPPAQAWVRRYFFAKAKEMLGRVRGKFSGNLKTPDSELTMEYSDLLSESKDEIAKLTREDFNALGIKELLTIQRQNGLGNLIARLVGLAQ